MGIILHISETLWEISTGTHIKNLTDSISDGGSNILKCYILFTAGKFLFTLKPLLTGVEAFMVPRTNPAKKYQVVSFWLLDKDPFKRKFMNNMSSLIKAYSYAFLLSVLI